MSADTQQEKYD